MNVISCQYCRAYVLASRADKLLGDRYGTTPLQRHNEALAAVLLISAETTCQTLRASGCCVINPQAIVQHEPDHLPILSLLSNNNTYEEEA